MSMRNGLLGLAGVLAATGAAAGRPTALPAEPHTRGQTPEPVVRTSYRPGAGLPAGEAVPGPRLLNWTAGPTPLAGFVTGMRDAALNRLTVPLGTVPVRDDD